MRIIQFTFIFLVFILICFAGRSCESQENENHNMRKLALANNKLAFDVYHQLASKSSGNFFFSPFSLSTAFGMLYHGSGGQTAKELRRTLGYEAADLSKEVVHPTFQHYLTQILPSHDTKDYVISSSNAAMLDKRFKVLSSYKREIQDYYQGLIKEVDFGTKSEEAVQEINKFVKDKTNGKIDKLLDELDPSTVAVLLNAVYFKGTWKNKFPKHATRPQKFYNNGKLSEAKDISMMETRDEFLYASDNSLNADIIEMPYKGENISMIVLLPRERDGLKNLQENLSSQKLKDIRRELHATEVLLSFPKFKMEYSKEMSADFKALGAVSAFSPGANFSGMTESKNIYVSEVLHKAVVEVNEEGSEAAAVTSIRLVGYSLSINHFTLKMTVDHPFLFAIVDKRNDMILFLGCVTNL